MQRAAEKFEEKQKEAESKEIEDILSNPISAIYNQKHPEVLKNAMERDYWIFKK